MKLKKVLSLALAIGSLATASSCFNFKVKAVGGEENNLPENIDRVVFINNFYEDGPIGKLTLFANLFNDEDSINMLRLYHVVLQKCLSVVLGNDIISNTMYIEKMLFNINEYTEDVAKYYEIRKEDVQDYHKQEVLDVCKKFLRYVQPYIIDHYFNKIVESDRSVSDALKVKLNFDTDTDDDLDCILPLKKQKMDK